nr:MAG TPA: hypothetical protein [Caudoviricetes sp.]
MEATHRREYVYSTQYHIAKNKSESILKIKKEKARWSQW